MNILQRAAVFVFSFIAALCVCAICFPTPAFADELSDTKDDLSEQVAKMDDLVVQLDAKQAEVDGMQAKIDEDAARSEELQTSIAGKRAQIQDMVVFFYKNPSASLVEYILGASDLSSMITRAEFLYDYTESIARAAAEEQALNDDLQDEIAAVSSQKDEQMAVMEDMKVQKDELQGIIDDLTSKKNKLQAEQQARLDAAAGRAMTFDTDLSDGEWHTGKASAYGGDDGAGSTTAMGTSIHNTPAIAVPMSWPNYRSYFGKKVEISYNGKSVIGVISDCGGFGKYGRDLDISYTVIRAWGFNSTSAWGVRTVKWRIL